MAIFRGRLPSKREIALVFAACVFPVHVWCILNVLREVPAWVLRLSSWELVGVISYALAFALLESVLFLIGLVVLGIVLPWFKDGFVSYASMVVLLTSAWAIAAHYNDEVIRLWGLKQFALCFLLYLASVVIGYFLIRRLQRLRMLLRAGVERLSALSFIYVFVDLLAVIIVVIRNAVNFGY